MDNISDKKAIMKIISSLDKIRNKNDLRDYEISSLSALKGENVNYEAGMDLTFFDYPRNAEFIPNLIDKMRKIIAEHETK